MSDDLFRQVPTYNEQGDQTGIRFVPVEPDYEAASEYARRVEGIYVSPEDVSGIVDAAYGIGGSDG